MKRHHFAKIYLCSLIFSLPVLACQKKNKVQPVLFAATPLEKRVTPGLIDEASGIADSKANPGHLWVEQDSGNPNEIALLSWEGSLVKKIVIKPAPNRDWEDMAVGNGPLTGQSYIYLAEIGDNNAASAGYAIYRFVEPTVTTDTVFDVDKIAFKYPNGSHDAEAMLLDNRTRDIYIITKRDTPSRIYKLPYPQSSTSVNTAVEVGMLNYSGVVSAALSANGDEIVIKTYGFIHYWKRKDNATIDETLKGAPTQLDYAVEPQGEAICFKNDNSGFFTLSEKPSFFPFVNLNFYRRK